MNELLGPILGLSFGITFSPEILIVGLWIASQKEMPLKKAWLFFFGGFVGVTALLFVGLLFSKAGTDGPSWMHFSVRALFGTLLLLTALHTVLKGHKLHQRVNSMFEKGVSPRVAGVLGLCSAVLNVKVISLATSAGHLLASSKASAEARLAGLAVFVIMSALPFLVAAAIASIKLGVITTIMAPCERLFAKYGRWIVVAICFVLGLELWRQALKVIP